MSLGGGERAGERSASGGWRVPLAPLVLVAVVAALYLQTARHAFVDFDDGAYITENPPVRGGLTAANVRWAFTEFHSGNWHPLTWLSHQLDVTLFGLAAGKHHLVNAALHALNACLCFWFLRRATGATWASALVALFFAVHPQRVESVAWASERKDVLAAAFFFLTLLAYERYARGPSAGRYALVAVCFVLGLMAKPMLVTLPVVLLLLDVWPLKRMEFRKPAPFPPAGAPFLTPTPPGERLEAPCRPSLYGLFLEKLPLLALSAASAVVTVLAQRAGHAVSSLEMLALDARIATAVLGTFAYLSGAVWPAGLAFFYPHPAFVQRDTFDPWGAPVWLGAVALLALTVLCWTFRRRHPVLLVGWGWMLVTLLPVIGLVQVGTQFHADRYAYLPLLGPTFALVFFAREALPAPRLRRAAFGLGLAAAALLAVRAHGQVGAWRDTRALCAQALAVTERNYVAHEQAGLVCQREGDLQGAREHYRAALAIVPGIPSSHSNLGALHEALNERELAIAEFREALRLVPDFLKARLSWGFLLEKEGNLEAALEHYRIATREHPESADAWIRSGDVELALGRPEAAVEAFARAVEGEPDAAEAHAGLAEALAEKGEPRAALLSAAEAQRLAPGHSRARHARAWVLATTGRQDLRDPARARALLEECARAGEPPGWAHLRVLAAVQAALGHYDEATRTVTEASAGAPRSAWERLKAERAVYAAGRALER